ncbi:LOW QUALITY PROTEIN: succinate dehydrogenase assembly factor 2, mitochondrial-like [Neltuma alba]|uniref:LOW QUALITY PROTEIN: succinate dehydrogenase assembly factor 2, mitochondrial-like n=1 Tax=Neltuma alba TaxID=207710 RepID=UPI0010A35E37|nr:LOW QUALITY PROTEIN: succinate dehydrogenase assembly factor 2, mitochondrial-like [Prosopis alba]
MASLRRLVINVSRVLNYASTPSSIQPTSNPLLRPSYGYALSSRFTSRNDAQSLAIDLSNEESKRRLFNRLLYRSKQRGFLELDLVLGKWVEENIHSLDENRLKSLIHVLDMENPDLWKWVSGQEQPPEAVTSNPVFAAVRDGVKKNLDSHAAPETRATPGQPWVRGWDDIKKGRDGPVAGNQ